MNIFYIVEYQNNILATQNLIRKQDAINAQMNPFFEMKVEKQFSDYTFRRMMTNYVDHLNLEFIKTTQEIKKQCKNTSMYSR